MLWSGQFGRRHLLNRSRARSEQQARCRDRRKKIKNKWMKQLVFQKQMQTCSRTTARVRTSKFLAQPICLWGDLSEENPYQVISDNKTWSYILNAILVLIWNSGLYLQFTTVLIIAHASHWFNASVGIQEDSFLSLKVSE